MVRYLDPVCKLCRREGEKLYLKGQRCHTAKCSIEKRSTPPGLQMGQLPKKLSEYGLRLRAKQKARRFYGLSERQFRLTYEKATRLKGVKSLNFLTQLERRLDNFVFRIGLALSRSQARQLVRHGHIFVNGKRVDIPSYLVKKDDLISTSEKSKLVFDAVVNSRGDRKVPSWIDFNEARKEGRIMHWPAREEIDVPITEHLIVEFYSR